MTRLKRRQLGVTLIELLITMVIVSIGRFRARRCSNIESKAGA